METNSKIKIRFYSRWSIINEPISFIPDIGVFNKYGFYMRWLGFSIQITKNNDRRNRKRAAA